MKFIKVIDKSTAHRRRVFINVECIGAFEPAGNEGTWITMSGGGRSYEVAESPSVVMAMIREETAEMARGNP